VVEVLRSGFAVGDRVLRPAEVVVSRAPREQPEA
jgi:molecular chaperone GrpE (heat shock protein)